jgi:anti-sigma regulatory factor (Ser/Thr protein kinase)
VSEWCDEAEICRERVLDIQLAVTEAVSNAVLHSGCTDLEVEGRTSAESLIIAVSDHGTVRADAGPGLGVGLEIMRRLAESVEFDQTGSGTRVTMRFDRRTAPAGGDAVTG